MSGKPGIGAGRLAPCPDAPHCVSSDAEDTGHRVEPLTFTGPPAEAWRAAADAVARQPRCRVITRTEDYLLAECRSALFRFVDDVELLLRPDRGEIAIRSCSRVGYYDFGVNRRRVETIRRILRDRGVVA